MRIRSMAAALCLAIGGVMASSASAQTQIEQWTVNDSPSRVTFAGTAQHFAAIPDWWTLTFQQSEGAAGAVWLNGEQDLRFGFSLIVDFYILDNGQGDGNNANGVVLVFQKDGQNAIGGPGQGMGAYQNILFPSPAIHDGFGIEVDTWYDLDDCYPGNHMSVQGYDLSGKMSGAVYDMILGCYPLATSPLGAHRLIMRYTDGILTVVLDTTPVILYQPMAWPLYGSPTSNPRKCYIGMTAGTGSLYNASLHLVQDFVMTRRLSPHENPGSCAMADWNMDGGISLSDITDFMNSFFSGQQPDLITDDIFAFLNTWFTCPG